ncbi:MAG TPA: FecR domain-containing protein [Candidatus Eremiobacteraceae bacterium]|nr:FecR domain-containing protein [Candidatus Eremiobacteraceae bacterium]
MTTRAIAVLYGAKRCATLRNWSIHSVIIVPMQTPFDPKHPPAAPAPEVVPKIHRVEVYWHAVTYKTVMIYVLIVFGLLLAGSYVAAPDWYASGLRKVTSAITPEGSDTPPLQQTQAKFVNLDGKVQVKKVNSVQWVEADYHTALDKGDLIQTASDGAARITFADGTEYTVKSDTLVTVEENDVTRDHSTTAVRINTGTVDLATGSSPDSQASVSVEDATAHVQQNSRATIKNDPQKNEHEIVVNTGSAQVQRGQEKIELTKYEKVSFANGGPTQKANVLAPPELVGPLNLAPIIGENPKTTPVHFEWKTSADAISYTLRISTTSMFTKMVKEVKVAGGSADVTGLDGGDYFWNVTAGNAKKETSETSETFKFTLVAQGKSQEMMLDIQTTQIHGRVCELIGRTEPGAALIINGQSVANIAADGGFRHFTEPLEPGQHLITVIGSNRRGGTAKQQVSIVIPK